MSYPKSSVRSLSSFLIFAVFIFTALLSFNDGSGENKPAGTCCQEFLVKDQAGNPLSGFTITLTCSSCSSSILYCVTGDDGRCTICNIPDSETITATATNPNQVISGSAQFLCGQQLVVNITAQ